MVMDVFQRTSNGNKEPHRIPPGHGIAEQFLECAAGQVCHDQIRQAIMFAIVNHTDNIWMQKPSQ